MHPKQAVAFASNLRRLAAQATITSASYSGGPFITDDSAIHGLSLDDWAHDLAGFCRAEADAWEAHAELAGTGIFMGQSADWSVDAWRLAHDVGPHANLELFYLLGDDGDTSLVTRSPETSALSGEVVTLFIGKPSDCKRAFDTMKAVGFDVMPERVTAEGWPVYQTERWGPVIVEPVPGDGGWLRASNGTSMSVESTRDAVRAIVTPPKPCTEAELRSAVKRWQASEGAPQDDDYEALMNLYI